MSVAWVGAGIAATGLVMSQSNADSAANAQQDAVNQANGLTQTQFQQTRNDNAPFLRNGTAGSNQLAYLLGLSTIPGTPAGQTGLPTRQDIFNQYEQELSTNGIDVPYSQLTAADKAGRDATVDARYAAALQAAQNAALPAAQADPNYGSLLKKFDAADLADDPIYNTSLKNGLDQGNQAINRQATSNGSLNSGATIKALARFSTGLTGSLGNDAFNRDASNKDRTYNELAGIAGAGQTASSQTGSLGAAAAGNVANNTLALGNSRAAGAIGQTNSINSGVSSAAQFYQNQQLLNRLNQTPAANTTPYIYGVEGGTNGYLFQPNAQ